MPFGEQEAAENSQKGAAGQAQLEAEVWKAVEFAVSGSSDRPSGDEIEPW